MSASSLPPEIIEAILRLLPVKSLGRFKSVSKTWNSLISDPHFIKKHLNHLQATQLILVSDQTTPLYSLDTNQLLPNLLNNSSSSTDDHISVSVKEVSFRCVEVYGSCNGLVLANDVNSDIVLINPTTQERLEIPLPPLTTPPEGHLILRHYGFGYESSNDDYKVVNISFHFPYNRFVHTCASVYSLRNNSWKELPSSLPNLIALGGIFPNFIVVNENVYWFTNSPTILAFSITTEEFSEIRLQNLDLFKGKTVKIYNLVDIGGKLAVFLKVNEDGYELWVMEDYGVSNSWTRVCCLEFRDQILKLLCFVEGSNRDIVLDVKGGGGGILVFNIDEEKYRNVRIEGTPGRFMVQGTYVESLESPARILTTS